METWDDLEFWSSKEWGEMNDKLDIMDRFGAEYNPNRADLFAALDLTPYQDCKVCIIGQDPYPQKHFATGVAFSIPKQETKWPGTLVSIIREYTKDLNLPMPSNGNLEKWCLEGVLLWNATPCYQPCWIDGVKLNVQFGWNWNLLTEEIVKQLSLKLQGVVFAFLGARAREFEFCVDSSICPVITTSHPSPRGSLSSKHPFVHSRLFSTINDHLVSLNHSPVDWRLA